MIKSFFFYFRGCREFSSAISSTRSVGQGWEVVEKHISGQKGYEKTDTVPVVVIDEEKEKAHET